MKLKGIDGDPHKRWSMWFNSKQREEPCLLYTSKIDQALEEVQDARVRVDSVLNELEDMKKGEMEHCGFGG